MRPHCVTGRSSRACCASLPAPGASGLFLRRVGASTTRQQQQQQQQQQQRRRSNAAPAQPPGGPAPAAWRLFAMAAAAAHQEGPVDASYAVENLQTWLVTNTPDGHGAELALVLGAVGTGVKAIASRVARAGLEGLLGAAGTTGGGGDSQKKLDVVANEIMKAQLAACGAVGVIASEEEEAAVELGPGRYVVVFDPLDGSSNIDANIPTGTIFGVYERPPGSSTDAAALQPGSKLVAAGYGLYSSATMLVLTTGAGVHGFTLDAQLGEWVITHRSISIPAWGPYYSLNDARRGDWPGGLRSYVDAVQRGEGRRGRQYSARYVCSLVADLHRTLLYGGWCGNPRPHLRIVYEGNPLAMLAEQAGGRGSDGRARILGIAPEKLHHRVPLFLGSPDDIAELESYGDVQQAAKKYAA